MQLKKFAMVFAIAGLSLTLVGAGLSAVFTDTGLVTQSVAIGTFDIVLSSTTPGAQIDAVNDTITYQAPLITRSTGQAPLEFSVDNVGQIPVQITVTETALQPGWSSLLVNPGVIQLNPDDAPKSYSAGLAWNDLGPDWMGGSTYIVYTVTANEVPAP
jgi:hypothetical protein